LLAAAGSFDAAFPRNERRCCGCAGLSGTPVAVAGARKEVEDDDDVGFGSSEEDDMTYTTTSQVAIRESQ